MDSVYIYYKYMACWAAGSIFKKLFRDGGRSRPTTKYMHKKNMKSCSTKAEAVAANPACPAVPQGLAGALGRALHASKPPEALLPVVIQLEFKDAIFSGLYPNLNPTGAVEEADSNIWFIKHLENCFAYI